jgi:hypothetical protein
MTSTSLWSVPSGINYRVLTVGDRPPTVPADFAGDVTFSLSAGDDVYMVSGTGALAGDGVRFFEKTPTGKDLRVWSVREVDGAFEAVHSPSF